MKKVPLVRAVLVATALTVFVVLALANPLTWKTRVTFSQSVRVPGTELTKSDQADTNGVDAAPAQSSADHERQPH